jgi:hypothetical protein
MACAALAVTVVMVFLSMLGPQTATAASTAGEIDVKGVGSTYAKDAGAVQAVAPGAKATYSIKVVNRGSALAQFKITTFLFAENAAAVALLSGTTNVYPLSSANDGYITAPIAPGKSVLLSLTVTPTSQASPAKLTQANVTLQSTANQLIGGVTTNTLIKAPATGTTAWDEFVRAGSGPFVGGSNGDQTITAAPIQVGQTARFTIRLQNDGTVPGTIGLRLVTQQCASAFTVKVKEGFTDVTAKAVAGNYVTPTLAVGARRDLLVSATLVTSDCPALALKAEARKGLNGAVNVAQQLGVWVAAAP